MKRRLLDFAATTMAIALPASPVLGAVAVGVLTQSFLGAAVGLIAGPVAVVGLTLLGTPLWKMRKDMVDRELNEKHGIPLPQKPQRAPRQGLQATKEFFGQSAVAMAAAVDYGIGFATFEFVAPDFAGKLANWLRPDLAGPGKTAAPPPPPENESTSFTSLNLRDCFEVKKATLAEPAVAAAPAPPKPPGG
ncbi:MAG: hypothetical protein ACAH83_10335 [Alphaproteobacteria bacterium]